LQIREHAITRFVACTLVKQYKCIPLPGQLPASGSSSRICFNAQIEIRLQVRP
jgi:hypothetical protein